MVPPKTAVFHGKVMAQTKMISFNQTCYTNMSPIVPVLHTLGPKRIFVCVEEDTQKYTGQNSLDTNNPALLLYFFIIMSQIKKYLTVN